MNCGVEQKKKSAAHQQTWPMMSMQTRDEAAASTASTNHVGAPSCTVLNMLYEIMRTHGRTAMFF